MQESWYDLARVGFSFIVVMVLCCQWHWNIMLTEEAHNLREKIKKLEAGIKPKP